MMNNKNSIQCPNCQHELDISDVLYKQIEELYAKNSAQKLKEAEEKMENESKKAILKYKNEISELTVTFEKNLAETNKKLEDSRKNEIELIKLKQEFAEQKSNEKLEIERAKAGIRESERNYFNKEMEAKLFLQNQEFQAILKVRNDEFQQKLEQKNFEKENLERKLKATLENDLRKEFEVILQRKDEENKKKDEENKFLLEQEKLKTEQISRKLEETQKSLNQGSTQLQGETQERILLNRLKEIFPYDSYFESRPGQPESDITQIIKNEAGKQCGIILYESKNTKNFSKDWLEKLKKDGFTAKADILVLVTKSMPDSNQELHFKDGIWICPIAAFEIVAKTLRSGLIMTFQAGISQQNRSEKMSMLYNFMVGNEFRRYLSAIIEGITNIKNGYEKEKLQLQKIWKQREKEFDSIISNATDFYGSIRGIAGDAILPINFWELNSENIEKENKNLLKNDSLKDNNFAKKNIQVNFLENSDE